MSEEKVAESYGTYVKLYCPYDGCGVMNILYLGRMDDMSAPDVEGLECRVCGKGSWLHQSIKDDMGYGSIDEAYTTKGQGKI